MNTDRQSKAIAFLRIAFGIVWAIDAQFKWQPAFANNFTSYIQGAMDTAGFHPGVAQLLGRPGQH